MLSPDLVRARRRGDKLILSGLSARDRDEAKVLAGHLLEIARASEGLSVEEVGEALACVERAPRHERLWAGLKKLVLDDCEFVAPIELDARELRRRVFELASSTRRDLEPGQSFERHRVLERAGAELGLSAESVEQGLYGDLKGAQTLRKGPTQKDEALLQRYELAQVQGVLLRAVRLSVQVTCDTPEAYRWLFFQLKFRQLLYRLDAVEGGYRIEIEGPFSLFESVTKYGLQFSLIVPALLLCDQGTLSAELRWGKERRPLSFETSWGAARSQQAIDIGNLPLRAEVAALLKALQAKLPEGWSVRVSSELLEIPGAGMCVPDLRFDVPGQTPVFLEVLGFWSREAVWKRVEWAQAGGHERVIFAVSSRLRVSEAALPDGHGAALYVFKGTMSAATVLAQVGELARR